MNAALQKKLAAAPAASGEANRAKPKLGLKLAPLPRPQEPARHQPLLRNGVGERVQDWLARCRAAGLFDPWPEVLPVERGTPLKPLKLGAHRELNERLQPGVMTPRVLRKWIIQLVNSPEYRNGLALEGAWRHELDGAPVEPVSAEHRAGAWERRGPANGEPPA